MTTTKTISQLAAETADRFQYTARGEDQIVTLKDGAPTWIMEMVYDAHKPDFLPDDWKYNAILRALETIGDSGVETEDDLDDLRGEYADGMVDVYNAGRLEWLSSHLLRASYCDDAAEQGLVGEDTGIFDRIGLGQYAEADEVFNTVARALVAHMEQEEEGL